MSNPIAGKKMSSERSLFEEASVVSTKNSMSRMIWRENIAAQQPASILGQTALDRYASNQRRSDVMPFACRINPAITGRV
jgi:hypothetical protein